MKTSKEVSTKEVKAMLAAAFSNARATAERVSKSYIAFNPQDADRRNRDLDIELVGIENLYYKMLKEIERIESM